MVVNDKWLGTRINWGWEDILSKAGLKGSSAFRWGPIWCFAILDRFVLDKDETSAELALLVLVKAKDPFMRICKWIGPIKSLEARRESAFTITEVEAPAPKNKALPHKEMIPTRNIPKDLQRKGKSVSPNKTRSQSKAPLPEVASKKG